MSSSDDDSVDSTEDLKYRLKSRRTPRKSEDYTDRPDIRTPRLPVYQRGVKYEPQNKRERDLQYQPARIRSGGLQSPPRRSQTYFSEGFMQPLQRRLERLDAKLIASPKQESGRKGFMAAPRDIRNIRETLQCSICLESFKDPRMLPCEHSFCLGCLTAHIQQNKRDSKREISYFRCPVCRKGIRIDTSIWNDDQIAMAFPQNNFLSEIENKVHVHESSTNRCKYHYSSPAEYVCLSHFAYLCQQCVSKQHRGKICDVELMQDASKKIKQKVDYVKEGYRLKIDELRSFLYPTSKDRFLDAVLRNTLKEINHFESQINDLFTKILNEIHHVRKGIDRIAKSKYNTYTRTLTNTVDDIEQKYEALHQKTNGENSFLQFPLKDLERIQDEQKTIFEKVDTTIKKLESSAVGNRKEINDFIKMGSELKVEFANLDTRRNPFAW